MKNIKYIILTLGLTFLSGMMLATTYTITDQETMTAALSDLNDGDELYFPTGTCTLTNAAGVAIASKTGIVVSGDGKDNSIVDFGTNNGFKLTGSTVAFSDVKILNAAGTGGIDVRSSSTITLNNVEFNSCQNDADGGAVYVESGSHASSIVDCMFEGNSCVGNGGAVYFDDVTASLTIEKSRFYDNTCTLSGSALYVYGIQSSVTFDNNMVYSNTGSYAICVQGIGTVSQAMNVRNNTIALNDGGLSFLSNFSNYTGGFFANAITENNAGVNYDVNGSITFFGEYNVIEDLFNGVSLSSASAYNYVDYNETLFALSGSTIEPTSFGLKKLCGRVGDRYTTTDIDGVNRSDFGSDIGAQIIDISSNNICVWTGLSSSSWTNTANWRDGIVPSASSVLIYIAPFVDSNHYPSVSSSISWVDAELHLFSNSMFHGTGTLEFDYLIVESTKDGTGQFLNQGTLDMRSRYISFEQYLAPNQWNFLCVPEAIEIYSLLGDYRDGDYEIAEYNPSTRANGGSGWEQITDDEVVLVVNKGYIVWPNNSSLTVAFGGLPSSDTQIGLTYNTATGGSTSDFGWNFIGNPYGIALKSSLILNSSNIANTAGSLYINDSQSQYQADYNTCNSSHVGAAQYVPAHQAFFVRTTDQVTSLVFDLLVPDMVDYSKSPSVVFKSESPIDVLTISVSDSTGIRDNAFMQIEDRFSDAFDNGFDTYKLGSRTSTSLGIRSSLGSVDYDVIAFSMADQAEKLIPLYLTIPDTLWDFSLSFDVQSCEEYDFYLKNNATSVMTAISDGGEVVVSIDENLAPSSVKNTYSLVVRNPGVVTGLDFDNEKADVFNVYAETNTICVKSSNVNDPVQVAIFDVLGKKISSRQFLSGEGEMSSLASGVYVAVISQNHVVESHKVIVR